MRQPPGGPSGSPSSVNIRSKEPSWRSVKVASLLGRERHQHERRILAPNIVSSHRISGDSYLILTTRLMTGSSKYGRADPRDKESHRKAQKRKCAMLILLSYAVPQERSWPTMSCTGRALSTRG